MEPVLGVSGSVLSWFRSFLGGRSQVIRIGSSFSASAAISSGALQGSILSPMLFAIYLLPLGEIAKRYGVGFHRYADDVQLYLAFPANDSGVTTVLEQCLDEIWSWIAGSWLRLNQKKTEVLLVGRECMCENLFDTLTPPSINGEALRLVKLTESGSLFGLLSLPGETNLYSGEFRLFPSQKYSKSSSYSSA
uniref:Reverse transcriptase domain-containing protein n=1 Tax=Latimeria chalumnae TaxID=7897 RepID=M3XH73_LATCH